MRISILIFCLSFTCSSISAQVQISKEHQQQIDSLKQVGKIYMVQDSLLDWMDTWRAIGKIHRVQYKDRHTTVACIDSVLAQVWRSPKTKKEQEEWMWLYQEKGYNQRKLGNYLDAKISYEKAYTLSVEANLENEEIAGYIFSELGNIYTRLGDYDQAIQLLSSTVKNVEYPNYKADAYSDLATAYRWSGDLNKAAENYNNGLTIKDLKPTTRSLLLNGLADVLAQQDKNKAAEEQLHATLKLLTDTAQYYTKYQLRTTHVQLANIYSKTKQKALAEAAYEQALFWSNQAYQSNKRREFAKIYVQRGDHFLAYQEEDKALANYQLALQSVLPDFTENDPAIHPKASSFYAENAIMEALLGKAEAFEQKYQESNAPKDIEQALHCLQLINKVEDELRQTYWSQSASLGLLEEGRTVRKKAIRIAYTAYERTKNRAYMDLAFELAERSKGMLLLEAIRGLEAGNQLQLPAALREKERGYKAQLLTKQNELFAARTKQDTLEITSLEKEQQRLLVDYQQFIQQLKADYPDYFKLKYDTKTATIATVQAHLQNAKTLFLAYFVADEKVYVFAIHQKGADFYKLEKGADFNENIATLQKAISQYSEDYSTFQIYTKQANWAFQELLAPIENRETFQQLIIVPDEILHYIPFETLLSQTTNFEEVRYDKLPYLILEQQVSYAYSGTLFAGPRVEQTNSKTPNYVGFAPTFGVNNSRYAEELEALSYNVEALQIIHQKLNGTIYLEENATVKTLKEELQNASILHLGTHAKMDDKNPLNSRIYFADTILTTAEIYNMPLQSELAVLSACETGTGKLYKGEGVMSLARGFMHAGCPSVVTSLWKVDDKSTAELLVPFYEKLKAGSEKDAALHQSKLQFLEGANARLAHPFYWSAFVHIGDTSAIYSSGSFWKWAIGLGVLLLGVLWLIYYRVR